MGTPKRKEVTSKAIRDLRQEMHLTQQEFANRLGIAIRTIARWENDQPPHGAALVKLAQLANARELASIEDCFVSALADESPNSNVSMEPELRAWAEGMETAFRHRHRLRTPGHWLRIAEGVVDAVDYAAGSAEEVGNDGEGLRDLHRQLLGALRQYREPE